MAKGEFIAFIDSDDWYIEKDSLEILYKKAIEHKVMICGGSLCHAINNGKKYRKEFGGVYKKFVFTEEKLIDYKDYQYDFGFYRFIFNREFLIKNNIYFPNLIYFEDPPFFVEAMTKAERFYALPNYTYCYRAGHQKYIWQEQRICDLIKGHIEDLKLSADAGLGELHALTIERLVKSNVSKAAITKGVLQNFVSVLELLYEAERNIKISILPENCKVKSVWQFYFDYFTAAEKNKEEINRLKACELSLKNSLSFRIGRAITWAPRKIRGGIHCYRQHGVAYTAKRTIWHISHLK